MDLRFAIKDCFVVSCRTHMEVIKHTKYWSEILDGRNQLGDIGAEWSTILK
jgi:hypothetical protein